MLFCVFGKLVIEYCTTTVCSAFVSILCNIWIRVKYLRVFAIITVFTCSI